MHSSNPEFDVESFLSSVSVDGGMHDGSELSTTEESSGIPWRESGYEGKIDYRIRQVSFSSFLVLHLCPRKFQLNRLRANRSSEESIESSITLAFGKTVGAAIQYVFEGLTKEEIIWKLFLEWETPDILDVDPKQNKSFWVALMALDKFLAMRASGFLEEYELVHYNAKPAIELGFAISFPGNFRVRGFVDAVLRDKRTGEIIVLECKTTYRNYPIVRFKNSAQALGYSIILDVLDPDLNSYWVRYLEYNSKSNEYETVKFPKDYAQRANWIRELVLDIELIEKYEEEGLYPMHGENCFAFNRQCEYFGVCQLSTENLTKKCTSLAEDKNTYDVNISLQDLIDSQLSKVVNHDF